MYPGNGVEKLRKKQKQKKNRQDSWPPGRDMNLGTPNRKQKL
jgi:hypothetical protein